MTKKTISLLQLYPQEMNIYGDWGNALVLIRRLECYGFEVIIKEHHPGATLPNDIDIIVGGGGQDSGQDKVQADLLKIGPSLQKLADDNVPMLMICGLYQLFGRFFKTRSGHQLQGISIFKAETHGGPERLIGNIVTKHETLGEIIGYENHSGLTYLDSNQPSLGSVIKGAGNNGKDNTEGAIFKNVIGSYLHGSLLPKNPAIADYLIQEAVRRKYDETLHGAFNDDFAKKARDIAKKRPR